jgi:hypothetical protein
MKDNTQIIDNKELMTLNGSFSSIKESLEVITKIHKDISNIPTPKSYVKKKNGMDYVEIGYMKSLADTYFPGWSWEIIHSEALGSEAYVVHGRLKWFDNGVLRTGDMVAAHRIQKLKGTDSFVDVGNDIKAANTDTMKKAFNMYMNISDDVYRNQVEDVNLTDKEIDDILKLASDIGKTTEIKEQVEKGEINGINKKAVIAKLERLKNDKD